MTYNVFSVTLNLLTLLTLGLQLGLTAILCYVNG